MTQISDEKENILLRNWYDRGYLERQKFENGAEYSYSYDWAPTSYYPARVTVTLPNKTTKELSVVDSVPNFIRDFQRR